MEKGCSGTTKHVSRKLTRGYSLFNFSFGGIIHKLSHVEEEVEDGSDDKQNWRSSYETEKRAYLFFNSQDTAQLRNGLFL